MFDSVESFPIAFIFFLFVLMVFIRRFWPNWFENENEVLTISRQAQNLQFDRIENLYTIRVDEDRSNFQNGVFVHLKSKTSFQLRAFWFVNIRAFYQELDAPDFRTSLLENRFLTECSSSQQNFSFSSAGEFVERIRCPIDRPEQNDESERRQEYPLVLLVHSFIENRNEEFFRNPIHLASLHLRSRYSDPATKILMKISKLHDGRSLLVQEIFVPGPLNNENNCAVCLSERVSVVLLPCRHSCLCKNCFSLVRDCPICRQFVSSYFEI